MAKLCGASIPDGLHRELHARGEDPEAVLDFGVAYATLQCAELLARGCARASTSYTLNRSPATRAILSARLTPGEAVGAGGARTLGCVTDEIPYTCAPLDPRTPRTRCWSNATQRRRGLSAAGGAGRGRRRPPSPNWAPWIHRRLEEVQSGSRERLARPLREGPRILARGLSSYWSSSAVARATGTATRLLSPA